MPSYIQGHQRDQVLLLPESVDDYVSANDPVRLLDAFVDQLDLFKLGFRTRSAKANGRPSYAPNSMIKLLIWGYLNRCKSSRELEKACYDRLGVIWLTGKITPDHSTIADFRKSNANALQQLLKEFNLCCMELGLFSRELVAIDGTFIQALNNKSKYFSKAKLKTLLDKIEKSIECYLQQLQDGDDDSSAPNGEHGDIHRKIEELRQRKQGYLEKLEQCEQSPTGSLCKTDPEARPLKKGGQVIVGYNVQVAVDSSNKLVVCSDIVEAANDRRQLHFMSWYAKDTLGLGHPDVLKVTADSGYGTAAEAAKNEAINIENHVLFQNSSHENSNQFSREDFTHDMAADTLVCPQGETLTRRKDKVEKATGTHYKIYASTKKQCAGCPRKHLCTSGDYRKTYINSNLAAEERSVRNTKEHPEIIGSRSSTVEHPFGVLKHVYFSSGLTCFGKAMAKAETGLGFLSYNIRRVIQLLGVVEMVNYLNIRRTLPRA